MMYSRSIFLLFLFMVISLMNARDCITDNRLIGNCGSQYTYIQVKEKQLQFEFNVKDAEGPEEKYNFTFGGLTIKCKTLQRTVMTCTNFPRLIAMPVVFDVTETAIWVRGASDSSTRSEKLEGAVEFSMINDNYYVAAEFTFPRPLRNVTVDLKGGAIFVTGLPAPDETSLPTVAWVSIGIGSAFIAIIIACGISCCVCSKKMGKAADYFCALCCSCWCSKVDDDDDVKKEKDSKTPTSVVVVKPKRFKKSAKKGKSKPPKSTAEKWAEFTCISESFKEKIPKDFVPKNFPKIAPRFDEPVRADELITIGKTISDESVKIKVTEDSQRKMSKSYDKICVDDSELPKPNEPPFVKGQDMRFHLERYDLQQWVKKEKVLTKCPLPEAELQKRFPYISVMWSVPFTRMYVFLYTLPLKRHPEVLKEVEELRPIVKKMLKKRPKPHWIIAEEYEKFLRRLNKIKESSEKIKGMRTGKISKVAPKRLGLPSEPDIPEIMWGFDSFRYFGFLSWEDLEALDAMDNITPLQDYFMGAFIHDMESFLLWVGYTEDFRLKLTKQEKNDLMEFLKVVVDRLKFCRYLFEQRQPATVLTKSEKGEKEEPKKKEKSPKKKSKKEKATTPLSPNPSTSKQPDEIPRSQVEMSISYMAPKSQTSNSTSQLEATTPQKERPHVTITDPKEQPKKESKELPKKEANNSQEQPKKESEEPPKKEAKEQQKKEPKVTTTDPKAKEQLKKEANNSKEQPQKETPKDITTESKEQPKKEVNNSKEPKKEPKETKTESKQPKESK